MASTSGSTNVGGKFRHQNFPTYQSHLSPWSSSLSTSDFEYDVFLSFRGDTRKSFTDHIYTDLNRNGIVSFGRGNEISSKLPQAIQSSQFCIVVLSKKFASSRWCNLCTLLSARNQEIQLFQSFSMCIPPWFDVKEEVMQRPLMNMKKSISTKLKRLTGGDLR